MNRSNVEEIKARLPIEEVIGSYIKVEKAGKSMKAKCPFHHEKTASFFISPDRGGYYCFGCGAKGDIFSFVEQFEGLDFKGALKVLADKAGITLTFDNKENSERDRLFQIMEEATKYFEAEFAKSAEAKEYVKGRGVTDATRQEFRIGWAPEGWRNLHDYLKTKKWSSEFIVKAGLAKEAEDKKGTYYDRFRGRVMFPIGDSSGRVIAFTGRILKDDGKSAKYLNSPDMPLFDKSSVLYGLDKAKSFIRRLDYAILVEGQMDLIMSHQAGVKNAVAASGTALTDSTKNKEGITNNLGVLRRLSPNIILALDSDLAGQKAAMRAVSSTALSMGMSVKIVKIEGGKDPADLIHSNPEDWKKLLQNKKHVIEFELENIIREIPDKSKLPRAVKDRILPLLSVMESEMDKAHYIQLISEEIKINPDSIWSELKKVKDSDKINASEKVASNLNDIGSVSLGSMASPSATTRIDLVERRMFGLLDLMEKAQSPKAAEYRTHIEKIAADTYPTRIERIKPVMGDIIFEVETLFGTEQDKWNFHMDDLIFNFERDMINAELLETMAKLRTAEKAGENALVAELAKKCQELSMRKAEIGKAK